jgi:hypothetical protein
MKNTIPFLLLFISLSVFGQPNISIENVKVEKTPGNKLTITYDLQSPTNDLAEVSFRATQKGGQSFDFNTDNATGMVGTGIAAGSALQIEWDYSVYAPIDEFRLMLVAKLNQTVDIQALVDQVDSSRLLGDLTFLEGIRHRTAGAAHLGETRNFIESHFLNTDLETSILDVPFGGYTGKNIVGRQIGTSDEETVYILDGHYDSVSNGPGADDNASAVAGMLEAMRILSPYGFKKSIRYIGFDLEESGLIGSQNYVTNYLSPSETVAGVLNYEMIGYYSDQPNTQSTPVGFGLLFPDAYAELEANEFRGDYINLVINSDASSLATAYENAAETYVPNLHFITIEAPSNWSVIAPDLGRSDHAPFWVANLPAIMLTDGANFRNPYYHTPQDTKDKLNFTFMHNVVQATIATLAEVAEIEHADTWWADTDFLSPVAEIASCDFSITPNPASDFLRLQWQDCQLGQLSITLMDNQGRQVRQQKISSTQHNSAYFDVRGLENGIYFLQIKNRNGQWAKKVVVD